MANTLRQARILSSETDNTIKQEQNTNVNIKISPKQQPQRPQTVPLYPNVGAPLPGTSSFQPLNPNINFTQANQSMESHPAGQVSDFQMNTQCPTATQMNQNSQYQYQPPINSPTLDRGVADLGIELDELDKRNKFLEMIIEMYENNPLRINSYIVCESKLLMNMIKLLTECDKVDLVLDDSDIGCGCGASSSKLIKISKILVSKNDETVDFKYGYNNLYTQFVRYGISLKMCC